MCLKQESFQLLFIIWASDTSAQTFIIQMTHR